jgi:glycosyltransferase involved in cell wall biosynthesis
MINSVSTTPTRGTTAPPRLRVLFLYPPGRLSRLQKARAGRVPTEFFFGGVEMEKAGLVIDYREVELKAWERLAPPNLDAWICRVFRDADELTGRGIRAARTLLREARMADCIVVVEEFLAAGLAFWALLRQANVPIVAIRSRLSWLAPSTGLARMIIGTLFRQAHNVVISPVEADIAQRCFSLNSQHLSFHTFGVDVQFWTSGTAAEEFVLCVGDSFRDYATLLRAAEEIDAPVLIVSSQKLPEPIPGNVTVRTGSWRKECLSDEELRDLYWSANCVVVPLEDHPMPIGQSVCLQALACAKPVVMTRTTGLWSQNLRDGINLLMVDPKDSSGLATQVNRLRLDRALASRLGRAGRKTVCRHFRINDFAARLQQTCQTLVDNGKRSHRPLF